VAEGLTLLLDQNIPRPVTEWLRGQRPAWTIFHAAEVELGERADREVFAWAQERHAIVATNDADFADQRTFPVGTHHGIIRLRVRPTTIEATEAAFRRLLATVPENELPGALVIVDQERIRVRPSR
jgi:predicted nuclease of predicted toxin-antitoxin system